MIFLLSFLILLLAAITSKGDMRGWLTVVRAHAVIA
jgi:hypothetical protein